MRQALLGIVTGVPCRCGVVTTPASLLLHTHTTTIKKHPMTSSANHDEAVKRVVLWFRLISSYARALSPWCAHCLCGGEGSCCTGACDCHVPTMLRGS